MVDVRIIGGEGGTRFPVPIADADTQPFWDAAAAHHLVVQHCARCRKWVWQPKPVCPRCHAVDPPWEEVGGAATVESWTVIHPPVLPAFADTAPFVVLLVGLTEAPGVRMIGQLVDDDGSLLTTDGTAEGVEIGTPVELRWREQDGVTLPAWRVRPPTSP